MKKLFNLDAPIVQALGRMGELMVFNALWVLCCLPIVTVGASTTAMHRMMFDLRCGDAATMRDFFRTFKAEVKKSTPLWLIMLAGAAVLAIFYYLIALLEVADAVRLALMVVWGLLFLGWLFMLIYVFPLTAYFENTVARTLKNALLISISHLRQTVVCTGLTLLPLVFYVLLPSRFFYLSFLWLFVLPGLQFYWKSAQLRTVFKSLSPEKPEIGE